MKPTSQPHPYFRRHIALPNDHGSWVFLLSPLLIGLFAGRQWSPAMLYLISGALAAFLLRQPASMAVKAYAGRRSRQDLPACRFWMVVYGSVALLSLYALTAHGYGYLLYLAVPGILVFIWHLWLVARREERYQMGIDIIASGSLALAAPAGYWIGSGGYDPSGWWLWALAWFQSAASIVYAFLRLEQRKLAAVPDRQTQLKMGARALLYSSFNFAAVLFFSRRGTFPRLIWIPYALQWAETVWGALRPAVGWKPTAIGLRQLAVSSLFTALFILFWK
jgi:hypothetical protein